MGGRGSSSGSGSGTGVKLKLTRTELNEAKIGTIIDADGEKFLKTSDDRLPWHSLETSDKITSEYFAQSNEYKNIKKVGKVDLRNHYWDRKNKKWVKETRR